jgi:hypothetical protein
MTRGVGGESSSNIMEHLRGVDYPTNKQTLIDAAKTGAGPDTDEVVDFLEMLPDREYTGVTDVTKAIGAIDRGEETEA